MNTVNPVNETTCLRGIMVRGRAVSMSEMERKAKRGWKTPPSPTQIPSQDRKQPGSNRVKTFDNDANITRIQNPSLFSGMNVNNNRKRNQLGMGQISEFFIKHEKNKEI